MNYILNEILLFNNKKNYLTLILLGLGIIACSQNLEYFNAKRSVYLERCDEIGNFAKTVLDSSYFFKKNVPEITGQILKIPTINSPAFKSI